MCNRPTRPITCPLDPLPLLNKGSVAYRRGVIGSRASSSPAGAARGLQPAAAPAEPAPHLPPGQKTQRRRERLQEAPRAAAKEYVAAVKKSRCELSVVGPSIFTCLKRFSRPGLARRSALHSRSWDTVSSSRKGLMLICAS